VNWYLGALKKYAVFSGRARRMEYWTFHLFQLLIAGVLIVVETRLGGWGLAATLYSSATFVPSVALTVRRLHDTGRSGWWMLISFVLVIGSIVLFVLMVLDGEPQANRYGPNPKTAAAMPVPAI
jgi:uncharacterized membrane protein YhaH (DUF805 family)